MLDLLKRRPGAADVAKRLLILRCQIRHALAAPPADVLVGLSEQDRARLREQFAAFAMDTCDSVKAVGLWRTLTPAEQSFLSTPGIDLDPQEHLNALWRTEAAGCLMWSLELLPVLPPHDTQIDPTVLSPVGMDGVDRFIHEARLRPSAEIDRARNVAELWHWRSRTRQIVEESHPLAAIDGVDALEHIIHLAASRAVEAGDLPSIIDGDFPALGKAFRDLEDQEWSLVRSIAMDRHFAFNWLCGRAPRNSWHATRTDM